MSLGKLAIVTGATGGIGSAYAMTFASKGYDLIITGRVDYELKFLKETLEKKYDVNVKTLVIDFAKTTKPLLNLIKKQKNITFLVNNAGFGVSGDFDKTDIKKQQDMVRVHIDTTMELTHAALPKMKKDSVVINVASVVGIIPMPYSAVYNATKSFVIMFSESLHMQLKKKGIRVQALCPGLTKTKFFRDETETMKLRRKKGYWMTPEAVVEKSIRCLKRKNKVVCIPGRANKFFIFLHWLLPRRWTYRFIR